MRNQFYGDKRDLVKWSCLLHLARQHQLGTIVQVAYMRPDKRPFKEARFDKIPKQYVPQEVWNHFTDSRSMRDIRSIRDLGVTAGLVIDVIDDPFKNSTRNEYTERVACRIREHNTQKVVFLDPDNGFEPKHCTAEHVKKDEVEKLWNGLLSEDVLVLYQHRWRERDWIDIGRRRFAEAAQVRLEGVEVFKCTEIANDVAFFSARKTKEA